MIAKQVPRTGPGLCGPRLPKFGDYALRDADPEIREALPDTGMQEKPYPDIIDIIDAIRGRYGESARVFVSGNTGVYDEAGNRLAESDARLAERQQRRSAEAEIARLRAELRRLKGE